MSAFIELKCSANKRIIDSIREANISFDAPCAGKGTCGKCLVDIINDDGSIDRVKACQTIPDKDLLIRLSKANEMVFDQANLLVQESIDRKDNEIKQVDIKQVDIKSSGINKAENMASNRKSFKIAIDIGTTTVVAALRTSNGLKMASRLNSQRIYGADVVSRIKAQASHRLELQKCLIDDILSLVHELCQAPEKDISLLIAANTTMIHLLMAYPAEGLAVYPFKAHNLDLIQTEIAGMKTLIMPSISTYIGGDIMSGVLACHMDMGLEAALKTGSESALDSEVTSLFKNNKDKLLIDLGTNGEMLIGHHKTYMSASTAAGPALEGGNLSHGIGGVKGAVRKVRAKIGFRLDRVNPYEFYANPYQFLDIDLIGLDKKADMDDEISGISGPGAISILALAVKHKLIDKNGTLIEAYFEKGIPVGFDKNHELICLTQDDIRQIQMAKAAICAGITCLIKEFYKSEFSNLETCLNENLDKVYIAGGLGFNLELDDLKISKMIPPYLIDKISLVGNSSLSGLSILLDCDTDDLEFMDRVKNAMYQVRETCHELVLSLDKDFEDKYIECMNF